MNTAININNDFVLSSHDEITLSQLEEIRIIIQDNEKLIKEMQALNNT